MDINWGDAPAWILGAAGTATGIAGWLRAGRSNRIAAEALALSREQADATQVQWALHWVDGEMYDVEQAGHGTAHDVDISLPRGSRPADLHLDRMRSRERARFHTRAAWGQDVTVVITWHRPGEQSIQEWRCPLPPRVPQI